MDRDAGLKAAGRPVRPQRMRVRKPVRDASGETVTADDPVHGDRRQRQGLLVGVAAEAHEQRLLVEQRDAAGERVDRRPRVECLLGRFGDRNLALASALAAHEQTEVPRVGAGRRRSRARRPRSSAERKPQSPSTRSNP